MGQKFNALEQQHISFILKQYVFFVSTYSENGFINLSPKGSDTFRVINDNKVLWLNLTGSGNETSLHIQENSKMTLMFCSFDKDPLILKIYGKAKVIHKKDTQWDELYSNFDDFIGARQIFLLEIKQIITSCGFAVPYYEYKGHRDTLNNWSDKKGIDGIEDYWKKKNNIFI